MLTLDSAGGHHDLAGHFDLLVDATAGLRAEDVMAPSHAARWLRSTRPLNVGFASETFWLRFTIENPAPIATPWILSLSRTLDEVTLYTRSGDRFVATRSGKKVPFSARPLAHVDIDFPLLLEPGETRQLLLQVRSQDTVILRPQLWTERRYGEHAADLSVFAGTYYGAMLAMIVYNLFLWLSIRDRTYLLYVLFQASLVTLLAALNHVTFQKLWPEHPEWAARTETLFTCLSVVAGIAFGRAFVGFRKISPAMDRTLVGFMALGAAMAVVALFTSHPVFQQLGLVLMITSCGTIIVCGLRAAARGSPNGVIFFSAWIILHSSGIASAAAYMGLASWEPLFTIVPRIGSFVEAMLLALGLARRFNQAQRANEHAQRQLVEHERARLAALGHLVGGVAHEVGNPLNFIVGGARELSRRLEQIGPASTRAAGVDAGLADARRALRLIERGGERIRLILENLRAHLTAGQQRRCLVDVSAELEGALGLLESRIEQQRITVVRRLGTLPAVWFSPGELGQVFLNVLINACQAMPDGGRIEISEAYAPGLLVVAIADTGAGVAPEHRARIFDPFFSTRPPAEGTGLGLSLSLQIMERNGGHLRLGEAKGGARFEIGTPLAEPATLASAAAASPPPNPPLAPPP